MDRRLHLTELIEIETLQRIQEAFSDMTGFAALTADRDGVAVTEGSHFTDFCKITRRCRMGRQRCERCNRKGTEITGERGEACSYICHAGLVQFAAPILVHGELAGCFIGGQVLKEKPNLDQVRHAAEELGIDSEEYVEAANRIRIVPKGQVDRAARFLYIVSNVMSDMAYKGHMLYMGNKEVEMVSKMKSDFLANMSHEIRTPMNAVIGMAEMALREEMTPEARGYIRQIKSSGQALLTIINDILDFSKIESGKMDIMEESYEPMSLMNDMVNIIMTRMGKKDVEFILDIPAELPVKLYGDMIRIKQIIVNLMNNAVKFTDHGQVRLQLEYRFLEEDVIQLQVAVKDTGHGIKPQDKDKLFRSFQQLDSKRNRNIEGTGLGLAICKQLLSLMGGDIRVESEYGKGSEFSFRIPQRVVKGDPSVLPVEEETHAMLLVANRYVKEQLKKDMGQLGVDCRWLEHERELEQWEVLDNSYLFVEQSLFTDYVQGFLKRNENLAGVLMVNFHSSMQYAISNLRVVKKPLYPLNLASILTGEQIEDEFDQEESDGFGFIAPEAEILIVDDNAINLTVAEGLLEPLQMKVDTALSGKEAISRVSQKNYDLIFMDHMMPEVDGVETTHIIRRFYDEYAEVPIIALTANAVSGTKEFFLKEGMNDFVAKPIEVKVIVSKLQHWLPPEKIKKGVGGLNPQKKEREKEASDLDIQGLDTKAAMELLGSEKLFWAALKDYYRVIDRKCEMIKQFETEERWKDYTIEVHALKSASRQIGAMELADGAERMEEAGNARDGEQIHAFTDEMLAKYRWHQDILKKIFSQEAEKKKSGEKKIAGETLADMFRRMWDALEELDSDEMEAVLQEMEEYSFEGEQKELLERLRDAVEDIDTESCEAVLDQWMAIC